MLTVEFIGKKVFLVDIFKKRNVHLIEMEDEIEPAPKITL